MDANAVSRSEHTAPTPSPLPAPTTAKHDDEPSVTFHDVLETINPLQYLPGIGSIYRLITGEHVHPAFRIGVSTVTSMLFGGPLGLVASMIGTLAEEIFSRQSEPATLAVSPSPATPGGARGAVAAYAAAANLPGRTGV